MKVQVLLAVLLPTLCLANLCYFPKPVPNNISCVVLGGEGGCILCNLTLYSQQANNCYPPCPAGYI